MGLTPGVFTKGSVRGSKELGYCADGYSYLRLTSMNAAVSSPETTPFRTTLP